MMLLGAESDRLVEEGITLVANSPEVISTFSDKGRTFDVLATHGFHVPRTVKVQEAADIASVGLPCIVKPAIGSGGSAMVFFAVDLEEAMTYADYIHRAGDTPLAQEYVDPAEGEFTVGVLSLPDGRVAGSIALKRSLDAKLSVLTRGRGGLVSSGYSQGHIGDYQAVRDCAESIAKAIGSRGALNIQGRVREGKFLPFEINPRLSASTYLRALAGFNEVDILLQYMAHGQIPGPIDIREGWYLRSLTESFVSQSQIKS
jgi:carbamoyl-phosphate synthase large subunit